MQEMNPDTVLEQAAPAADPEPQAVRPAEDTSIPSAPEAPAAEAAAPQPEAPAEPAPVTVVDIRFRNNAKSYFFDPNGLTLAVGDHVIIDTARGDEFGICAAGNHAVRPRELVLPLRKVLRAATAQDERINAENQEKEKKAFDVCQQKILSHKLDMQLVSAECAFDGSKILFFFTAEGRVTSASWSRIWRPPSARASSSGRSACATRPRWSADSACAAVRSAARNSSTISSPSPSRWPRRRTSV